MGNVTMRECRPEEIPGCVKQYSSCFLSASHGTDIDAKLRIHDFEWVDHDSEVEKLYQDYMSGKCSPESWAFHERVMSCALRLIGKLDQWFDLQEKKIRKNTYRYEFLCDIIHYLKHGRFKVTLSTWYTLLEQLRGGGGEDDPEVAKTRDAGKLANAVRELGLGDFEYLKEWSLKPDGVSHILCTMHVLFGKPVSGYW